MTGTRLEIDAHVVSVLTPHITNVEKVAEMIKVQPKAIVTPGIAATRELDIGGATTNIAVYSEGDLQFTAVLPVGGMNITNDLAIGLKVDPSVAEKIKIKHALATKRVEHEVIKIKHDAEDFVLKLKKLTTLLRLG